MYLNLGLVKSHLSFSLIKINISFKQPSLTVKHHSDAPVLDTALKIEFDVEVILTHICVASREI